MLFNFYTHPQVIFEEFYDQGDEEKKAGRKPIPMMDRDQPEQQAVSQLGFLYGICIPCYTLLYRLIPDTKPMLAMCNSNLERWHKIAQENKTSKSQKQSSIVSGQNQLMNYK